MPEKIEFKKINLKADESGSVSAVIAQFGVVDLDGDIVEPTAFKNGQEVAIVWSHDWSEPVGKGAISVTETEAIFNGSFFMETQAGQEAYKTVKAMGDLQEWSWGFHTITATWEQREDQMIRHLVETEVYEVSPVLKGAGIGTRTLMLKNGKVADLPLRQEIQAVIESVDSLGERVRSLKGLREEEGREISEERMNEVKELSKRLRDAAEMLEKSIVMEAPKTEVIKEYVKFQNFIARQNGVQGENDGK